MPWIDPIEQFAKPPRLGEPPEVTGQWSGDLHDGPNALIEDVAVQATTIEAAERLSVVESTLSGVKVVTDRGSTIEVSESALRDCDLTGTKVRKLRSVTIAGSRLSGANLSEGSFTDVLFDTCTFQYANLRSAKLERVAFVGCKLEEADFSGAKLTDVSFDESELLMVDLLDCYFERVDLRSARTVSIGSGSGLAGCLITDAQVLELAYGLALRAGVSIERSSSATPARSEP